MLSAIDPDRILMIRPSALGDVCRTVPVAASLKRHWPKAHIDWLVQDGFQDAIAAHPAVDGCVLFGRKQLASWWYRPKTARTLWRFLQSLRKAKYDLVIDCQGLGRSGFFTWVTRAPIRVGSRQAREAAWLGYNKRTDTSHCVHTVDRMLAVLDTIDVPIVHEMKLYVASKDAQWWSGYREEIGIGGDPYVVLAPTSRWPSKRWPTDRWLQVAKALAAESSGVDAKHVIVIGAPGEESQTDQLVSANLGATRLHNCCGSFSVGQTMAVIESSNLVVANDSAPLHMAVGLERPIVALFGPTDPAKVGPFGHLSSVLQHVEKQAFKKVNYRSLEPGLTWIKRIQTDEVIEACHGAMASTKTLTPTMEHEA